MILKSLTIDHGIDFPAVSTMHLYVHMYSGHQLIARHRTDQYSQTGGLSRVK